jgi:hypothetical protein
MHPLDTFRKTIKIFVKLFIVAGIVVLGNIPLSNFGLSAQDSSIIIGLDADLSSGAAEGGSPSSVVLNWQLRTSIIVAEY